MRSNYALRLMSYFRTVSICSPHGITCSTEGIQFSSNALSSSINDANGGCRVLGEFYRLFGGSSIADFVRWSRLELRYAVELGRAGMMARGLSIHGIQTAVREKWTSASLAQKLKTITIGEFVDQGPVAIGSTIRFSKPRKDTLTRTSVPFKDDLNTAARLLVGNILLLALGLVDVSSVGILHIERQIPDYEFDWEQLS